MENTFKEVLLKQMKKAVKNSGGSYDMVYSLESKPADGGIPGLEVYKVQFLYKDFYTALTAIVALDSDHLTAEITLYEEGNIPGKDECMDEMFNFHFVKGEKIQEFLDFLTGYFKQFPQTHQQKQNRANAVAMLTGKKQP